MIVLILAYLVVMFSIAVYDWTLLLVIPLAIVVSKLNQLAIKKELVGKVWHNVQLGILVTTLGALVLTKLVKYDEIVLLLTLYYVTYETSLNFFRKLPLEYIGKTSVVDKLLRKMFKKPALLNQMTTIGKFFLLFIGIAIYLTGK